MNQAFLCTLLLFSLYVTFGKYVYITEQLSWQDAQKHCQELYTDLAPVTNALDTYQLQQLTGNTTGYIWIGMKRSSTNKDKWFWSGGGEVTTFYWETGQPDDLLGQDYGLIKDYKWHDAYGILELSSFCYSAVVVRETKTWEEALWYCTENHHNLASVTSGAEMLLIQKELGKNVTTEQVWMGLRFLPEYWLWVDKEPLSYEAWGQDGNPPCPDVKQKCGALNTMQGMQSNSGTGSSGSPSAGQSVSEDSNVDGGEIQIVWEAHDCGERLHFICY